MELEKGQPLKKKHPKGFDNLLIDPEEVYNEVRNRINDNETLDEIKSKYDFAKESHFIESFKDNYFQNLEKSSIFNMFSLGLDLDSMSNEQIYTIASETIVLKYGRPSLLIQDDKVEKPESDVWKKRIDNNIINIENNIPSVGRIELTNHPTYDWCGTGWLIKNSEYIITNRHVARLFATKKSNNKGEFKLNLEQRKIQPFIDFKEEYRKPEEIIFRIDDVVYIADEDDPDVAILAINPQNLDSFALPEGLEISNEPINNDSFVYTIGYPAKDSRIQDSSLMENIFKGVYNVKRLAPGKITDTTSFTHQYYHDCSTLGGNSGSPVIDLITGKVVGLHYAGAYRKHNWAVQCNYLNTLINNIL